MSVFRIAKSVKLTPEIKAAFTHMFVKQSAKGDVWSLSQLFANHRELKEVWIEVLKGYKTDLASYKNYYAKSVQGDFAHALRKNDPQEYIQLARETLEERPRGAPLAQIHKTHLVFLIDMARSNSEAKIAVQTLVKDPLLLEAAQEEYPEGLESLKL